MIDLPSESYPSKVKLTISPMTSTRLVRLLRGGPGLYCDFSGFIFQVPVKLSAANTVVTAARDTTPANTSKAIRYLFMLPPEFRAVRGEILIVSCGYSWLPQYS